MTLIIGDHTMESLKTIFETQFQSVEKRKKFKLLFIVILIEAFYKVFFIVDDELRIFFTDMRHIFITVESFSNT